MATGRGQPLADGLRAAITGGGADDDGGENSYQEEVVVNNVAPELDNLTIDTPIDEGDYTYLSGVIVDPGDVDTFTLTVNWDDNTTEDFEFGTTAINTDDVEWDPTTRAFTVRLSVEFQ